MCLHAQFTLPKEGVFQAISMDSPGYAPLNIRLPASSIDIAANTPGAMEECVLLHIIPPVFLLPMPQVPPKSPSSVEPGESITPHTPIPTCAPTLIAHTHIA